jgi:hypothetical protein
MELEPEVEWPEYPRVLPGIYPAYCMWAKVYRDPGFHRWTCLLRFELLAGDLVTVVAASVPKWFNLGVGVKPHAGRRSKYFAEWIRANRGCPPARHDRMSPKVFTHRMAHVRVEDTSGNAPYSVIQQIVSWETGPDSGSLSQQVTQSRSANGKGSGR